MKKELKLYVIVVILGIFSGMLITALFYPKNAVQSPKLIAKNEIEFNEGKVTFSNSNGKKEIIVNDVNSSLVLEAGIYDVYDSEGRIGEVVIIKDSIVKFEKENEGKYKIKYIEAIEPNEKEPNLKMPIRKNE